MATATAYVGVDMINANVFYGTVIEATSTQILISDGFYTALYNGQGFSYSGSSVTGGTLTSFVELAGSSKIIEAYDFAVPAPVAAEYIQANNLAPLFSLVLSGNDRLTGSGARDRLVSFSGNDFIDAGAGNDDVFAGEGNDAIRGGAGLNQLDGGAGLDVALYGGPRSAYIVQKAGLSINVSLSAPSTMQDQDQTIGIERFQFTDGVLAFDVTAAQNYRLYKAAFDRTPDTGGLSFWVNKADDGTTLVQAAQQFIGSAEFVSLYGSAPSDAEFIDHIYQNVLDRMPDQNGYDFWLAQMASGRSRADVLVQFSESPENQANVAGVIGSGIWLDLSVA